MVPFFLRQTKKESVSHKNGTGGGGVVVVDFVFRVVQHYFSFPFISIVNRQSKVSIIPMNHLDLCHAGECFDLPLSKG